MTNIQFEGPNLILAGPGTGKTTYLILKIVELIKRSKQKTDGIIVATFTRKATEEIKYRLFKELPVSEFNKINFIVGTIHSICYELLARYSENDYGDYQILPEDTQVHFIYSKLKNLGFSSEKIKKNGWVLAEELADVFNKITDEKIKIDDVDFKDEKDLEDFCKVHKTYKKLLHKNRLFDFATIQETLLFELISNQNFKKNIEDNFKYYFVDEYQDVNNIQDELFKILASPNYNLTVVGDDDQSIYGFRGANVQNMNNFQAWFKERYINCEMKVLATNYRSSKEIVELTNFLIKKAEYKREEKNIKPYRLNVSHKPVIKVFNDDIEEADYISDNILQLKKKGIVKKYNEISILFRSVKSHSNLLIFKLSENKIPYKLIGAGNLFENIIGLEYMALMDFYLAKDIEKEKILLDKIANIDIQNHVDLTSTYAEGNYIEKLELLFNDKKFYSCIDLTYEIFKAVDFFRRYYDSGENIGIITSLVLGFDDFSDYFDPYGLFSYLTYLQGSQSVDFISSNEIDSVNIMTIHQAKGLEFPIVFMPSQNDRLKKRTILERFNELFELAINNIYEERRAFYVGCTRAEELLVITSSKYLIGAKKEYSPTKYFTELLNTKYSVDNIEYSLLKSQIFRNKTKLEERELVLSYNKIRLYDLCPYAYMFANVWNLETVRIGGLEYGRNIHKILEVILRELKKEKNIDDLNLYEIIEENWKNSNFRNDEENDKFKKSATKQIHGFIKSQRDLLKKESIIAIEDEFNVMVDNNLITGRFDAVFRKNDKHLILDFKTGDYVDYTRQLSFYSLCYSQKYAYKEILLAVFFLKTGQLQYITPSPADEEIRRVKEISLNIKSKKFAATPGKHCSDCAYNTICTYSKT